MARQDYMTIAVPKSTQDIFRKFIEVKELTVKEALSDMLEMYMMAEDQELYLQIKEEKLNVEEARAMLFKRKEEKVSLNDSIFMKLGITETANGGRIGGVDTMEAYSENCDKNGYTWYGTNSLKTGMNEDKVKNYNEFAEAGKLKIYFAMNQDQYDNEIAYVADVKEIVSYTQPTKAPCELYEYPDKWEGLKYNIWIKISNLKKEEKLSASDFIVSSTGNNLKEVITKGQYIFGYIKRNS